MCVCRRSSWHFASVGQWLESDDYGRNKFLIFIYGFNLNEHVLGVERGAHLEHLGTYGLVFTPPSHPPQEVKDHLVLAY